MRYLLLLTAFFSLSLSAQVIKTSVSYATAVVETGDYPAILDTDTEVWFENFESNVTKDGSNLVSQWTDLSGNGNHVVQATAGKQPLWTESDGIQFSDDNMLELASLVLNQPVTVYLVIRQDTWEVDDEIFRLADYTTGNIYLKQSYATPMLQWTTNTTLIAHENAAYDLELDTWGIVRIVYNGATSSIQANELTADTGDAGTRTLTMLRIGQYLTACADFDIKAFILRTVADDGTDQQAIYDYLEDKFIP